MSLFHYGSLKSDIKKSSYMEGMQTNLLKSTDQHNKLL